MASNHPIGTVTVKVEPDVSNFVEKVEVGLFSVILHQFSEWLDADQHLIKDTNPRTHDDLVKQFLAERSKAALPVIEPDPVCEHCRLVGGGHTRGCITNLPPSLT